MNTAKVRRFFRFGKDEHIVRLHIGLEDPKDLISDLKRSLKIYKVMKKFIPKQNCLNYNVSRLCSNFSSMGMRQTFGLFLMLLKKG